MLIRSQSLLTLCNPSFSSVLHIIYSTVNEKNQQQKKKKDRNDKRAI